MEPDKMMIGMSGAMGTGKTTAMGIYFQNYKMNYPKKSVQPLCNLEGFCPYHINKETTEKSQLWIFGNQIKQEMAALQRFDIVITDCTIIDIIAYTHVAGFTGLAQGMMALAEQHIQYYSEIYFKKIAYNQHCYPDGIREATDPHFRQDVEDSMLEFWHALEKSGIFPGLIHYV